MLNLWWQKFKENHNIYIGIYYIPKVTQQSWGSFAPATRQYHDIFLNLEILAILKSLELRSQLHCKISLKIKFKDVWISLLDVTHWSEAS